MKITLTLSTKNLSFKQLAFLMKIILDDKIKAWCRITKEESDESTEENSVI